MRPLWKFVFSFIVILTVLIWIAVVSYNPNLRLIACEVGQGDAFLVSHNHTQILIDGGPGSKVVNCLSKYMPFWDRNVEMVILTHPQKDHYMGLIEVLERYDVDYFLANSLDSSSQEYQVLKSLVGGSDVEVVNPVQGQHLRLGLIYLDILWPPNTSVATVDVKENVSGNEHIGKGVLGAYTSQKDPNETSIIAQLSYGSFDALFTGDIGPKEIDNIVGDGNLRDIEYLKVPHHGSKNGLTVKLLEATTPEIAVISAGHKNSYGHPHKEVLDMLSKMGIKILRTDLSTQTGESGDVVVNSDGEKWWIEDN